MGVNGTGQGGGNDPFLMIANFDMMSRTAFPARLMNERIRRPPSLAPRRLLTLFLRSSIRFDIQQLLQLLPYSAFIFSPSEPADHLCSNRYRDVCSWSLT